ncbi:MAG: coproporphyrinogen dehydrogenase HemZ [Lachnospiraceae bacterium]
MLQLIINRQELSYDIYALTQAFYPGVELKIQETLEKQAGDTKEQPVTDQMKIYLLEEGGTISMRAGEILQEDFCREISEEELSKEAEIFLEEGLENATARKRAFKNLFYDIMTEYTGRVLPWGNLTGIRPTKLIRNLMNENAMESLQVKERTAEQLYRMHRLQGEKLELGMEIAGLQNTILSDLHGLQGYSLYIGIPFCPSRCLYCSFTSNPIAKWQKRIQEYLAALKREMEYVAEAPYFTKRVLDTVYIGGGTPTALSADELEQLLNDVTTILPMEHVKEFTVEAGRADSITREKLEVLQKYHVSRISINPQTMKDETLQLIGRRHSVEEVRDAYALARNMGFDNINMDIILGLPGETCEEVAYTIEEIKKLAPDNLTVHSLAVKRAAGLKDWYKEAGDPRSGETEKIQRMMETSMKIASEGAAEMGLVPYYLYRQKNMAGNLENTGYAAKDKYGLYNILIMEELQSIVALGAGTVSKRVDEDGRIERCDNVKDIGLYLDQIEKMIERKRKLFK